MLPVSQSSAARPGSARPRRPESPRNFFIAVSVVSVLCFVLVTTQFSEICDTRQPLAKLLGDTTQVLHDNGITDFWLDKGTLLGAIRENDLIQWEYDVDISLMEEDCKKVDTFKHVFMQRGLYAYNRSDFIEQKRTRIIIPDGSWLPSYQSPYLTVPCYRVYDSNKKYFVDIYWKNRIPLDEVKANREKYLLPADYDFEDDLLCDAEGLMPELHCCGGCDKVSTIFPLKPYSFVNKEYFHVPNNSSTSLTTQFGKSWRIKMIKGYKKVMCFHIVFPTFYKFISFATFLAGIYLAYLYWQRPKMYEWKRLRNIE